MNLAKQSVVDDNVCLNCTIFLEMAILALWVYEVAKDVWSRSLLKLQKCSHGKPDMIELIQYLLNRISLQNLELFFMQSWFI